jgi:hypothetical protein
MFVVQIDYRYKNATRAQAEAHLGLAALDIAAE